VRLNTVNEKEEAKTILMNKYNWDEKAVRAALNPTPRQAKDRGFLTFQGEEVNPEQVSAIRFLKDEGWDLHKIALAVPVPEAQVAKVLYNRKILGDIIKEQDE